MRSFTSSIWNYNINCYKLLLADFLDLTLEDVGRCIELVYTPVRQDGTKGSPRSILSDIIAPG